MRPVVFLDRDGVLNVPVFDGAEERPPWSIDELAIEANAASALRTLRAAGYVLVVITNQPDVGRGLLDEAIVHAIHDRLRAVLPIDAFYTCVHSGSEPCACRKPRPGMLLDAADQLDLDLDASWLVGDRWVDIAAGRAAGVRTVLIERHLSWTPTSSGPPPDDLRADAVVGGIEDAVATILASRS